MADNTTLDSGDSAGDVYRSVDRSGVKTSVIVVDTGGTSSESLLGDAGVGVPVDGLVAEDAAASGNPIPFGGRYDATPRTLDNGDRGECALDSSGNIQMAARDNATDTITASLDTAAIMNDTTALTPKFVSFQAQTSGNNTILAAVSAKKIRVLSLVLVGPDVIAFESGAGGTALTGDMDMSSASAPFVLPFNPVGWFETASNTLLNMEIATGGTDVSGCLTYVEV